MSMYNLVNGRDTPLVRLALPMVDITPGQIPRFRDVFLEDVAHPQYDGKIHIFTRVGGNNRGQGYGEEFLLKHPLFVATFDDDFDNTYATYVFNPLDRWASELRAIVNQIPESGPVTGPVTGFLTSEFLQYVARFWADVERKKEGSRDA